MSRMRRAGVIALVAAAAGLAAPGSALAQGSLCSASPGTAASEQYCELVPGAGGDQPRDGAVPPLGARLPPRVRNRLAVRGPAGGAVLGLPAAAPAVSPGGERGTPSSSPSQRPHSSAPPGVSASARPGAVTPPLARTSVGASSSAGDVVGPGFYFLLAALVLAVGLAFAARGQRRST